MEMTMLEMQGIGAAIQGQGRPNIQPSLSQE